MSNNVGIVKAIDSLGRVVIPKEMRERFGFIEKVEIVMTEKGVLIRNSEYELVKKN